MTKILLAPSAFVLVLVLAVYGCNSPDSDAPTTTDPAQDMQAESDHSVHDHGDQQADMEKMNEQLASFSPEDRESAIRQHFCPVGGEMLGSMGAPEKVDVNGQVVWICCDGCRDKLLADPDTYLAKLGE
jgi:hypothetical protein